MGFATVAVEEALTGAGSGAFGSFLAAFRFQLFQPQLQLLDLPLQLLRLPPKLHPMQLRQEQLPMLDLAPPRLQLFVLGEELPVLRQDQRSQRIRGKSVYRGAPPLTCAEYRMNARVLIPVCAKKVVQRISPVTPTAAAPTSAPAAANRCLPAASITAPASTKPCRFQLAAK